LYEEALTIIDRQLLELSHRHRLIQNTILTLYLAILTFLSSMLVIALAQMFELLGIALLPLFYFCWGQAFYLLES
jgi:uncharacterized membrane protein